MFKLFLTLILLVSSLILSAEDHLDLKNLILVYKKTLKLNEENLDVLFQKDLKLLAEELIRNEEKTVTVNDSVYQRLIQWEKSLEALIEEQLQGQFLIEEEIAKFENEYVCFEKAGVLMEAYNLELLAVETLLQWKEELSLKKETLKKMLIQWKKKFPPGSSIFIPKGTFSSFFSVFLLEVSESQNDLFKSLKIDLSLLNTMETAVQVTCESSSSLSLMSGPH